MDINIIFEMFGPFESYHEIGDSLEQYMNFIDNYPANDV